MNILTWVIQTSVIVLLGVALSLLFRIRHPRTQLAYLHTLLVACIVLPLIEPWYHPLLLLTGLGTTAAAASVPAGLSWTALAGWVLALGMTIKLVFLGCGIRQVRRFRAAARPLPFGLESICRARTLVRADAMFGISGHVDGPATLGYLNPIVLLPESFLSLDQEAQLGIACHELLHVRRNDWLVMLFEEIVSAALWFNPAIWLLLSQIRLRREQLVDSEVLVLTASPQAYVYALLEMAGAVQGLRTFPAAPFLSNGHLAQRIRSLLTKRNTSGARLFLSYVSMALLLVMTGWCLTLWFPLTGEAQSVETFAKTHRGPPVLLSWKKAFSTNDRESAQFTVKLPPPASEPADNVMFFINPEQTKALHEGNEVRAGLRRLFIERGVRVFQPGEIAAPEEIAQLQAVRSDVPMIVEVIQSADGTIQRIKVQRRRFADEIHSDPTDSFILTGAADGNH